jgi:hypothetical protein
VIIRESSPSCSDIAATPNKSSPTRGVNLGALDAKDNDLRMKLRYNDAKAKRRGNRSNMTYSPLLKEQMMVKKNKEANSVILMKRPIKIQEMD